LAALKETIMYVKVKEKSLLFGDLLWNLKENYLMNVEWRDVVCLIIIEIKS
jgi:hypothetical protein